MRLPTTLPPKKMFQFVSLNNAVHDSTPKSYSRSLLTNVHPPCVP